jgi:hypothetical protein
MRRIDDIDTKRTQTTDDRDLCRIRPVRDQDRPSVCDGVRRTLIRRDRAGNGENDRSNDVDLQRTARDSRDLRGCAAFTDQDRPAVNERAVGRTLIDDTNRVAACG